MLIGGHSMCPSMGLGSYIRSIRVRVPCLLLYQSSSLDIYVLAVAGIQSINISFQSVP